ncbi:MAG: efflux RND transporter periplasmic adaptor subunit [Methylovirgula sp.]
MKHRFPPRVDPGRNVSRPVIWRLAAAVTVALPALALSACSDRSAPSVARAAFVRTEIVQPQARQNALTLTGDVQARFSADLSFRVSGRVTARMVDVGAHINAGDVLARIDPVEQRAEVDAATAAVAAAHAQLLVAQATFDRQHYLIAKGFTTRVALDQAQEGLRNAEGSLEVAKSQQATAKDTLGYTELRADAAGVITARNLEIGQVVQAGQPVFTLAKDGERDAAFDVAESILFGNFNDTPVSLRLLSNPNVTAIGHVREVSPAVDPKSSTVRVKVTIQNPPAAMMLGSAVAGTGQSQLPARITVPWTALMARGLAPAVWVIDPATRTVTLRQVTVAGYEAEGIVIESGLKPGERVVIDGGKLLSAGQPVAYEGERS